MKMNTKYQIDNQQAEESTRLLQKISSLKKIIGVAVASVLFSYGIHEKGKSDMLTAQSIWNSPTTKIHEVKEDCMQVGDRDICPVRQKKDNSCAQATISSVIRSISGRQVHEDEISVLLGKEAGSNSYTPQVGMISKIINDFSDKFGSDYLSRVQWGVGDEELQHLLKFEKSLIIVPYYSPVGDIHYGQAVRDGKQVTVVSSGGKILQNGKDIKFHHYTQTSHNITYGALPTLQHMSMSDFLKLRNAALVGYSKTLHSLSRILMNLPVIAIKKKSKN